MQLPIIIEKLFDFECHEPTLWERIRGLGLILGLIAAFVTILVEASIGFLATLHWFLT